MPRKSSTKKDKAIEAIPALLDIATDALDAATSTAQKRKSPSTSFGNSHPTKFAATSLGAIVTISPSFGAEPVWPPVPVSALRESFKETGDIRSLLPSEDVVAAELYGAYERAQRYLRKVEYHLASVVYWQDRIISLDGQAVRVPQRVWNLLEMLRDD